MDSIDTYSGFMNMYPMRNLQNNNNNIIIIIIMCLTADHEVAGSIPGTSTN